MEGDGPSSHRWAPGATSLLALVRRREHNGTWNTVLPRATGGNFHSRIWDSAHVVSRDEPSVFSST